MSVYCNRSRIKSRKKIGLHQKGILVCWLIGNRSMMVVVEALLSSCSREGYVSPCCRRFLPDYVLKTRHQKNYNPFTRSLLSQSNDDDGGSDRGSLNERGWKVGNVYDDFDRLERAIAHADAEIYERLVKQKQDMDVVSRQRRPVHTLVSQPLFLALLLKCLPTICLTKLLFMGLQSTANNGIWRMVAKYLTKLLDWHYWVVVVAMPLLMLWSYRQSKPKPPPPPQEVERLKESGLFEVYTPQRLQNELQWEDPETSCSDAILCLLEQCMSCVKGAAALGLVRWFFLRPLNFKSSTFFAFMCAISQLLNRLGMASSFHQYPQLYWKLQWNKSQQSRPMEQYKVRLLSLMRAAKVVLPLGVASDLTKVLMACKQIVLDGRTASFSVRQFRPFNVAFRALGYFCLIIALIGPIWHLVALKRIVSLDYGHAVSNAYANDLQPDTPQQDTNELSQYKWRWDWQWREPERISQLVARAGPALREWYFHRGSILEQDNKRRMEEFFDSLPDEIERIQAKVGFGGHPTNITAEMEALAAKHKRDYESGNYTDPLGLAVWKVFGIGLSYDFDHWSDLDDGEEPSLWRLRARAAKSAIRRAQQIYSPQAAKKELDSIVDTNERDKRAEQLKQEAEYEMQYLANSLKRLIPFNAIRSRDKRIKYDVKLVRGMLPPKLRKPTRYKMVSDHEMWVMPEDNQVEEEVPEIAALLERYGPGKKNHTAEPREQASSNEKEAQEADSIVSDDEASDPTRDEFVNEYLKQKYFGDDNDDDGTKFVLA